MSNGADEKRSKALIQDLERTKPEFVGSANMDKAISVMMRLAMEISVLRDRLATQEALLKQAGVIADDAIETHEPSAEAKQAQAKANADMIEAIIHDLA